MVLGLPATTYATRFRLRQALSHRHAAVQITVHHLQVCYGYVGRWRMLCISSAHLLNPYGSFFCSTPHIDEEIRRSMSALGFRYINELQATLYCGRLTAKGTMSSASAVRPQSHSRSDRKFERGKDDRELDRVAYQFWPSLFIDLNHSIVFISV